MPKLLKTGVEQSIWPGDANIGGQRQVQPSTDSSTVDRSDRGQRAFADGHEPVVQPLQALFGRTAQRRQVGTGAERLTRTGDDHGVHIRVGFGPLHGGAQLRRHLAGDSVASFGVVDRNQRDMISDAE